jgi:uracil-DNA glycosylase
MSQDEVLSYWKRIFGNIHPSWMKFFDQDKIKKAFYQGLYMTVDSAKKNNAVLCPLPEYALMPFILSDMNDLKVVILGQDPYPDLGDACGASFSLNNPSISDRVSTASLKPILGSAMKFSHVSEANHGCLFNWINQGVLLINVTPFILLSGKGTPNVRIVDIWALFANELVKALCAVNPNIVWVLWGGDAKAYQRIISTTMSVITCHHPSPRADNSKPEGSRFKDFDHFGNINKLLSTLPKPRLIDWRLEQETTIYIDGACMGNHLKETSDRSSGYGIVFATGPYKGKIYYQNTTKALCASGGCGYTSSNRSELYAMIKALEICLKCQFIGPLSIRTDSQYSYNMVTSWINIWDSAQLAEKDNIDLIKIVKNYSDQVERFYCKYGGCQYISIKRNSDEFATKADKYSKVAAALDNNDMYIITE